VPQHDRAKAAEHLHWRSLQPEPAHQGLVDDAAIAEQSAEPGTDDKGR